MQKAESAYDLIVVGGGPAGMMSAGRAGEMGASVLLLEKNTHLGKKLLISGGGRSNVTNAEFDTKVLLRKYGKWSKFLHSPFAQFDSQDTFDFFESLDMPMKIEAEKRAFPKSDSAQSVLLALEQYMQNNNVVVRTNSTVADITQDEGLFSVACEDGSLHFATRVILSTGGLSHPETGSTGDGFRMITKLGHQISSPNLALVPIRTREKWGHELSGLSFAEAKVTLLIDGKPASKKQKHVGKILFTHEGLSGPLILNMSKAIGEALQEGITTLKVDIFPTEDRGTLDKRLRILLDANLNKKIKNVLRDFIPTSLVDASLRLHNIDEDSAVNILSREKRLLLLTWWKAMTLTVTGLMGRDRAVVTSGGVDLADINTKTMESKKMKGLFIVGDMLDIDRPSGGYSLQLCWTTGYVAGTHAGAKKSRTDDSF